MSHAPFTEAPLPPSLPEEVSAGTAAATEAAGQIPNVPAAEHASGHATDAAAPHAEASQGAVAGKAHVESAADVEMAAAPEHPTSEKWYRDLGSLPTRLAVNARLWRADRRDRFHEKHDGNNSTGSKVLRGLNKFVATGAAAAAVLATTKLAGAVVGLDHHDHDGGVAAEAIHQQAGASHTPAHEAVLASVVTNNDTTPDNSVDLNGFDTSHLPHDQLTADQQQWLDGHHSEGALGAYDVHSGADGLGKHGTVWNQSMKSLVDAGYDPSQMDDKEQSEYVHHVLSLNHMTEAQAAGAGDDFVPKMPSNGDIFTQVTHITAGREGGPLMPSPTSDFAHHLGDIKNTLLSGHGQDAHTGGGTTLPGGTGSHGGHPGGTTLGSNGGQPGGSTPTSGNGPAGTGSPASIPGSTPVPDVQTTGGAHTGHIDGHPGPNGHLDGHPGAPLPPYYVDGTTIIYDPPTPEPGGIEGVINTAEKGFGELTRDTWAHDIGYSTIMGGALLLERTLNSPEWREYRERRQAERDAKHDQREMKRVALEAARKTALAAELARHNTFNAGGTVLTLGDFDDGLTTEPEPTPRRRRTSSTPARPASRRKGQYGQSPANGGPAPSTPKTPKPSKRPTAAP
ncbi:MAG TPA: hypothetical protein VLF71_04305 [Candidatus Saccharimonadales bacterium]|nr:hypothetical protein [Candidatus Saccharimonadales bacterium]